MLTDDNNKKKEDKDLEKNLDKFLNNGACESDECQINDPEEIVKRENKKIITNDGRQLLSEYTRYK
jgi:hypothetical protein